MNTAAECKTGSGDQSIDARFLKVLPLALTGLSAAVGSEGGGFRGQRPRRWQVHSYGCRSPKTAEWNQACAQNQDHWGQMTTGKKVHETTGQGV